MAPKRRAKGGAPEVEDASIDKLGPEFQDVGCLFNSDVTYLLNQRLNPEEGEKHRPIPNSAVFNKTLAYLTAFTQAQDLSHSENYQTALRNILLPHVKEKNNPDPDRFLTNFEMAQLGNFTPESAQEAVSLIPTLSKVSEETLQSLLDEITALRR